MDNRITRIETRIDSLGDKVGTAREELARLAERVSHLPGKLFYVGCAAVSVGVIGAVVMFSEHLKALIK